MLGWFARRRHARNDTATDATPPEHRFFWLSGRRHVANAPYLLPKDDREINRLDFQHYTLRSMLHGNFVAPIRQPLSILDVGSGTGRWALQMAEQFPDANVVSVDLVAAPADDDTNRPANYTFVQGNILQQLPFAAGSFDFVHQRLLFTAIPLAKWPDVVHELIRVTRPRGWIELVEGSLPYNGGPAMAAIKRMGYEMGSRFGTDFGVGAKIGDFLHQGGLTHVKTQHIAIPVGSYGGRMGTMMATDVFAGMAAVQGVLVAQAITTAQEYESLMATAHREVEEHVGQCIVSLYIAYGQRPGE